MSRYLARPPHQPGPTARHPTAYCSLDQVPYSPSNLGAYSAQHALTCPCACTLLRGRYDSLSTRACGALPSHPPRIFRVHPSLCYCFFLMSDHLTHTRRLRGPPSIVPQRAMAVRVFVALNARCTGVATIIRARANAAHSVDPHCQFCFPSGAALYIRALLSAIPPCGTCGRRLPRDIGAQTRLCVCCGTILYL